LASILTLPLLLLLLLLSPQTQGTLTHMAPEMLMHGRCSKASDVYAFGILLWEVATGGKAFAGGCVGGGMGFDTCGGSLRVIHALFKSMLCALFMYSSTLMALAVFSCAAGIPKPLLGHCVISQGMRPTWPPSMLPGSSSAGGCGSNGGSNGSSGGRRANPWAGLVALADRCWAQEPQDRWVVTEGCLLLLPHVKPAGRHPVRWCRQLKAATSRTVYCTFYTR
jgi:hypothetical protein